MEPYLELLKKILEKGDPREARYGKTLSLFGKQMRFSLSDGFPAVTTKKLAFRTLTTELIWFISGSNDNNELTRLKCNIWTANANADYWTKKRKYDGDLGRIYGVQWRKWKSPEGKIVDQLQEIIERIKVNPYDRRLLVSAWNPGELDQMALPPCHIMFQFFVKNDNKLSLSMYQRSADMFLGVPFNIASYALLLNIVAQITGMIADELIITLGDAHICDNHITQVKEQLSRKPHPLPTLWLNPEIRSLSDIHTKNYKDPKEITENFARLENYTHHPRIIAPMGV